MTDTTKYHKIQTMYLRDPDNNYKTLLDGQWALPEFELLQHCKWQFTEKVDGTNIRIEKNILVIKDQSTVDEEIKPGGEQQYHHKKITQLLWTLSGRTGISMEYLKADIKKIAKETGKSFDDILYEWLRID